MNTIQSSDLARLRRRYVHACQFGLVNFSDNPTVFFKLMNVNSSLFLNPVVALVLLTGISDVLLLLTCTLVPVTTTSFHVTFELFNGIYSPFVDGLFPITSPRFSTCHNFQQTCSKRLSVRGP